jgi:hypothetical protein
MSASTISPPFVSQQPSSPIAGIPFPSRAPTPKLNRRLLPRRPKHSDAAACTRYRLRKKGTLVDELRSTFHHYRREAQAYNQLVTSSLINLRSSLAEVEIFLSFILSRLPVSLTMNSTLSTKPLQVTHTSLILPRPPLFSYEILPEPPLLSSLDSQSRWQ